MNRDLFIEFASRSGEFHFRQRLPELPARVGRSLQNDFVIDDPYVAASHLEIDIDPDRPGKLLVRDLGSINGMFLAGRRVKEAPLNAGEILHFGHTTLRLRLPDEAVAAERVDTFASRGFSFATGIVLTLLLVVLSVLEKPLSQFNEIVARDWMITVLGPLAVALFWATLWAMPTRIFSGRAQFGAHLAIGGWGLLGIELSGLLLGMAAYAFSAPLLAQLATPAYFAIGVWALSRHLSLAQLRWPRANFPLALLVALIPLTMWMLSNWERRHSLVDEPVLTRLYPPALRVAPSTDIDHFIAHVGALRAAVDAQRTQGEDSDLYDGMPEE